MFNESKRFNTRVRTTDKYYEKVGNQLDRPVYDVETDNFKVNIIASSSEGNCTVYNNSIIIDHGLAGKNFIRGLEEKRCITPKNNRRFVLFYTHEHSDHCETTSLLRNLVFDNCPFEYVYGPDTVIKAIYNKMDEILKATNENAFGGHLSELKKGLIYLKKQGYFKNNVIAIENGQTVDVYSKNGYTVEYEVTAIEVPHTVKNFAYVIKDTKTGSKVIHATDLTSTETLSKDKYEVIAIENNYDENSEAFKNLNESYKAKSRTHLSTQQAIKFIVDNINDNGKYCELHANKSNTDKIRKLVRTNMIRIASKNKMVFKNSITNTNLDITREQALKILKSTYNKEKLTYKDYIIDGEIEFVYRKDL